MFNQKNISQKVLFTRVVDRVRRELSYAADDPELIEVFDYLISLGVGENSYVDELEEFAKFFVNSKLRQLRFTAFGFANKVPENCPLVKIALIKRAFRKKPTNGFCPSPEADWGKYEPIQVRDLEALLRFFHGTCRDELANAQPTPQSRSKTLANIDVACTDAFYAARFQKSARDEVRRSMLVAGAKFATELGVATKKIAELPWIDFDAAIKKDKNAGDLVAPNIVKFDEETGEQLSTQVEVEEATQTTQMVRLPWREWIKANDDAEEPDKASAVAALHALLENFGPTDANVDVIDSGGQIICTSAAVAEVNAICIPPCISTQARVYSASEHPFAVRVFQKVMKNVSEKEIELAMDAEAADSKTSSVCRENTFYVLPEWKTVEYAAVAGEQGDGAWKWKWKGKESMHPYWAVRRLSFSQLAIEQDKWTAAAGRPRPRFNCELKWMSLSSVCMALINAKAVNRTRLMEVPFLVNKDPLEEKEELLLEIERKEKKAPEKKKRTWKDVLQENKKNIEKEQQKQARIDAKAKSSQDGMPPN